MPEPIPNPPKFWVQVFPGLGIGLLVGLLVGLSISPVVSGLLTTLGGLLAAILGIQPGNEGDNPRFRVNGMRIGAFGLACILGVFAGMTLRIKDVLATPLQKQIHNWVEAGYDSSEARQYVAFQVTGLYQKEKGSGKLELASGDIQKKGVGALFSSEGMLSLCKNVRLNEDEPDSIKRVKNKLEEFSTFKTTYKMDSSAAVYNALDSIAQRIGSLSFETQFQVLKAIEEMTCVTNHYK